MKKHIQVLAALLALLLFVPLVAAAADDEPEGYAAPGDVTLRSSSISTDDANGNVDMRLFLLYKGTDAIDGRNLEFFEISPVVGSFDEFPFEVTWSSYTLEMGDMKTDGETNPFRDPIEGTAGDPARKYFEFNFKTKKDVVNGYYPITFKVRFLHRGQDIKMTAAAETTISVYVHIKHGTPPATPTPTPTEKPEIEATPKPVARVILKGYEMVPSNVTGGEEFDLKLVLENTNVDMAVRNMKCTLSEAKGTVLPSSGSSSFYIASIGAQETTEVTLRMTALPDAGVEPVKMTLDMEYDDKNSSNKESEEFTLPIHQVIKLDADEPSYPGDSYVDESFNLMMRFYNTGKTTMYNTRVFLESETLEADETLFAGNIAPGGQSLFDVMVTAPSYKLMNGQIGEPFDPDQILPGGDEFSTFDEPLEEPAEEDGAVGAVFMGYSASANRARVSVISGGSYGGGGGGVNTMVCDGTIVITYEDNMGVAYRHETPISVNIMSFDQAYQDSGYNFYYGKDYDPSSGLYIDRETGIYYDPMTQMPVDRGVNPLVYIGIAAGVVVLLVAALVIVLKVRKKNRVRKEQQMELEEGIDAKDKAGSGDDEME